MLKSIHLTHITDLQRKAFRNLLIKKRVPKEEKAEMISFTDSNTCTYEHFAAMLADLKQRPAAHWKDVVNQTVELKKRLQLETEQ